MWCLLLKVWKLLEIINSFIIGILWRSMILLQKIYVVDSNLLYSRIFFHQVYRYKLIPLSTFLSFLRSTAIVSSSKPTRRILDPKDLRKAVKSFKASSSLLHSTRSTLSTKTVGRNKNVFPSLCMENWVNKPSWCMLGWLYSFMIPGHVESLQ